MLVLFTTISVELSSAISIFPIKVRDELDFRRLLFVGFKLATDNFLQKETLVNLQPNCESE